MVRKKESGNDDGSPKAIDSILFKLISRLVVSLVVILAFLTLVQCTIKKPESPEWTTNFVLPVINRTYYMAELIRRLDQTGVAMDSLGNITYTISEELDTVTVSSDYLTTPNLAYSFGQKIDTVSIASPTIPAVFVDLGAITGISASTPADTVTVGQQSFDISNNLPIASSYTAATIASGTVNALLLNNLGIPLDTVILEFWDNVYNNLLATDSFYGGIPSGSAATIPIDFSGRSISNSFRIEAHCHTTGGLVTQTSTRGVSTEVDFVGSITVTSATAEIPALSRSFSDQVNLLESDRIDTARIASGNLAISISNATNLNVNVSLTIPDILQGGQALGLTSDVSPQQTTIVNIDLAGYEVIPTDVSIPQALAITAVANVPGTAPYHVFITQSDSFYVTATLSGLTFNSVAGYFDSVAASFNGISQSINVPAGFDSIQMTTAILTLEVTNSIDLPGDLDIRLDGNNGKNLNLVGAIAAGGSLASAISTIIEPAAGNFLSPVPSLINVGGSVVFANGGYQGRIEANDFISARVTLVSPLEMVISSSRVDTDIDKTKIDQADIDVVTNHVNEARFIYNIISHLPIGAQVDIYFGPDSATLFSNPQLLVNALQLPAAPFDVGGIVTDTISTGFQDVYLDSNDIRILQNDTLYFGTAFNLAGTGGQMVKLTANDYLSINGRIEVSYRFDGQF